VARREEGRGRANRLLMSAVARFVENKHAGGDEDEAREKVLIIGFVLSEVGISGSVLVTHGIHSAEPSELQNPRK
jgi:hypothetical protein